MRKKKRNALRATKEELQHIREVESRSVEERLAAGELEVVPPDEIPSVLRSLMESGEEGVWTELPKRDLKQLLELSKRTGRTPAQLLAQWAHEKLQGVSASGR